MGLKEKMETVLNERKTLNMSDDYGIRKYWNKIIQLLS